MKSKIRCSYLRFLSDGPPRTKCMNTVVGNYEFPRFVAPLYRD